MLKYIPGGMRYSHRSTIIKILFIFVVLHIIEAYFKHPTRTINFKLRDASRSGAEEEFERALNNARKNDAEWLSRVFGEMPIPVRAENVGAVDKTPFETKLNDNIGLKNSSLLPLKNSSTIVETLNMDDNEMDVDIKIFDALGYSMEDVFIIKPSIRRVITDKSVYRPKKGIPPEWRSSTYLEVPEAGSTESIYPTPISQIGEKIYFSEGDVKEPV